MRETPVLGAPIALLDRLWWARTILRSSLVDAEYYSALRGRRTIGRRASVLHYVFRGFRRGMSVNPLFDETVAGGELPEVLRVPALYAYLVSERRTVTVNPWWDAPAYPRASSTDELPPLERVWSDPDTVLELRAGGATALVTTRELRERALQAAREWRRPVAPPKGSDAAGERPFRLVRIVQARDRRYHRKLDQAARLVLRGQAEGVVSLVDVDASQWVSAAILGLVAPGLVLRRHDRHESWATVVEAARARSTAPTLVVLDARAEFADEDVDTLVAQAGAGAVVTPAHRSQDGTLLGVGAAAIGRGRPARVLSGHPQEDLDVIGSEILDVPLLTGRTFAGPRELVERAGGISSGLVNGDELEVLSGAVRRAAPDALLRVLTSMRPVLEEPDVAFPAARIRQNARVVARAHLADGRRDAESIIRAAGFRVLGWTQGDARRSPEPRLEWVRPHEAAQRWAIKICAPAGRQGAVWGDTHFAQSLSRALVRCGHSVVIDAFDARARRTSYLDDVSVVIRGPYRIDPPQTGVRLQWIISHPDEITRAELRGFDRVFAASRRWSERTTRRWGIPVSSLLEATDTDLFRPRGLPRTEDIVFVGTARGIPRPSVVAPVAAGIPVRVYGPDWRPFLPPSAIAARSIPHAELPARYETASVVLNDQWPAMRREGFIAMRPFDVVAVGGRVISEDVDEIEEIFGGAVVTYRDAPHLVRLLRSDPATIFPDDAELDRIGASIREHHSFDARAAELVRAANEVAAVATPRHARPRTTRRDR